MVPARHETSGRGSLETGRAIDPCHRNGLGRRRPDCGAPQRGFSPRPTVFLWPVLGLGPLLFVPVATKVFNLWIKRDHTMPARGLGTILGLACVTLLTGIIGTVIDLYLLAGGLETSPELADVLIPKWLRQDMTLLSVSTLLALGGGLAWFVLNQWLRLVDGARNAVLGRNHTHPPKGETRDDGAIG